MPRRRTNWNFVGVLVAIPVVGVVGGVAWHKLRPKDPNKFIAAGDLALRQGDLPAAIAAYSFASGLRPTDAGLHLKLAKLDYSMKDQGGANVRAAVAEWTKAEELQPDLKEAWQGLLDANMAQAIYLAQNPKQAEDRQFLLPEQFGIARDAANHLLKLDPDDSKARSAIPILSINLWMSNLAIPPTAAERALPVDKQPTEAQRIDRAVAELTAAMRDHPENADLPYWIAQAKIEQGVRLSRQIAADATGPDPAAPAGADAGASRDPFGGDREAAVRTLFGEAAVVFDDPIARQPRNAQLYFKKFEALNRLMQVDRSPEAIVQYQRQMRAALDAAQANVSPADGLLYTEYKSRWADYLAANDPAAAEAAYQQLLERSSASAGAATRPARAGGGADVQRLMEDVQVRLKYARLLERDPARRDDALAVLDKVPTVAPQGMLPALQEPVTRLIAAARLERAHVLTDQLVLTNNPTTREKLIGRVTAEIDAVAANPRFAGEYLVLKARGRLQMVTRSYRDAIQTLTAAADRLAASGGGVDDQLLGWQAAAYADGGQPVLAIRLLEQAVKSPPGSNQLQPHLLLAQLYLQQQDYENGRRQVAWLSERYPDDLNVMHLEIQALGRQPDPGKLAELYGRLPERTAAERSDKAGWAVRTGNRSDAERLMELVYAARPGDPPTALKLAELYNADGDKGRANQTLQQAMDAHPESAKSLQLIKDSMNGASSEAVDNEAHDQIETFKDPLLREVALAKLAGAQGNGPEQVVHLENARAIQPDNRDVLNDLFLCYLTSHAYDKAGAMIPRLTELDVDQAHGQIFRFRLAMAQRDTAAALAVGQRLTHDYPQFANSWACLGQAQQATGQLEAAAAQYTAALSRQGNDPDTLQRLVDCLIRLGRLDDARRALTDARRQYPDAGIYRRQLVQVEVAYGDPEAVLPIVDEPVQSHPEVQDNWQTAVQAYAAAAQRRAAKSDPDGANKFTDHVRQLLGEALKRWPDSASFAAELGDVQVHDGTDAGVAAAADTFRALAATPKWAGQPLPDVLLGRMYLQAKRPEAAEPPLRHALALDPNSTDARTALADSLVERHQPDAALAVLVPAKAQPQARAKYVDLLLAMGRGAQAQAELLADLKAHPADPGPANLLAHVYASQGKFDAAMDMANQALATDPKDAAAYFIRGATEASRPKPDLDAAAKDLTTFCAAYPDNVQGRIGLARVLVTRHDLDGATRQLEAAVDLAPDNKEARLMLANAYASVFPARLLDAERVIAQALSLPQLAHDPEVQRAAAVVYLKDGKGDLAVTSIRDAMANAADQRALLNDYLTILLDTKHYDLLLEESAKFTADPQAASWAVYDFRGRARAASGDVAGALTEFATALDLAGAAATLDPPLAVASHVTEGLGIDRAVQLVGPRSENGANWKVVLAACYNQVNDRDKALAAAEGAMASVDSFPAGDRRYLTRLAAILYMTAVPPQPDRALPLFQGLLRDAPDDIDALNNVACILAEQVTPPRPGEALRYSGRAFDLVRKAAQPNPYIYDTQGWVLILTGRVDDGVEVLRQVVDAADFPDVHYHLAQGYLRKGEGANARRELAAAAIKCQEAAAARRPVDASLAGKIAAAQARADQMSGPLPPDKR